MLVTIVSNPYIRCIGHWGREMISDFCHTTWRDYLSVASSQLTMPPHEKLAISNMSHSFVGIQWCKNICICKRSDACLQILWLYANVLESICPTQARTTFSTANHFFVSRHFTVLSTDTEIWILVVLEAISNLIIRLCSCQVSQFKLSRLETLLDPFPGITQKCLFLHQIYTLKSEYKNQHIK